MPTTTNTLGQRVLARVAMQLGGAEIAAQRLGIAPSLLRRFIDGSMPVPDVILLRAVDYILEDISEPIRQLRNLFQTPNVIADASLSFAS